MLEEIVEFINTNRVATVCCVESGLPHCFNCLYAYLPELSAIVFKSSATTLHSAVMQQSVPVAGTIYYMDKTGFDTTGVQFYGKVTGKIESVKNATKTYYKRYPFALLMPGEICVVAFDKLKFSKTTNGIKRKHTWENPAG